MIFKHWKICLFPTLCCIWATFATAAVSDATEVRVVVLLNGGVLRGQMVPGEEYIEIQAEGTSVRIRKSAILLDAASLLDAYEQQRKSVDRPTAAKHLELADWCIQQKLWPQAARELLDARGLDADLPRIALLEQRLTLLSSAPRRPQPKGAIAEGARPAQIEPQEAMVEAEDYPAGTLELFTRRIQPMLVNNCTLVGCHREEGPCRFQLSRALLYGESNRRTTRRNFLAALKVIDQQTPIDSPLLTIPLRTHGGSDGSIFPPHRRQLYDQLVAWVKLATSDQQMSLASKSLQDLAAPAPITNRAADGRISPATYSQPPTVRRGPPRVRFGIRPPASQFRQPLGPEAISHKIMSGGVAEQPASQTEVPSEPIPQPIEDTGLLE